MRASVKIALLLIYSLFHAGMSYSMHFCGEDFKRINLYAEQKTCCPEAESPMPCCEDVSHVEQPNRLHVVPSSEAFTSETLVFPVDWSFGFWLHARVGSAVIFTFGSQPSSPVDEHYWGQNRPRLHVQHGVFLI
ncbi:HYC_CC_PP family protein [Nitritalea halalkaliphila]|nr:hypothetical protein [Nitritalea halalkaliphila]